ncbi:MAG: SMC-Scp complex subunit ScpB [Candidatus Aenigmarchaeota archaeon]|nr:SMC-Scp complex subunit ScpB [Candidatus Aenigmarchaeota archaeon]
MEDLKGRLESLLFASGKKLSTEQLSKLSKEKDLEIIRNTLREVAKELGEKKSSIMLVEENDEWRLTVREQYLPYVRKIVTKTELPKGHLETLAVAAYKAPALQSEIIKIRTNKGYKHLDELEKLGYISREKKGRSKLIRLTQKFFNYFDVPPEKLKEKFKKVEIVDVIERVEDKLQSSIEVVQEKIQGLEVYDTAPSPEEKKEQLGSLEVFPVQPGEEHEHRKHLHVERLSDSGASEQQPAKTELPVKEIPSETKLSEEIPAAPESKPAEELKPEEFTPEVKELISTVQKEKVKGMFPEGVPEDVEKAAAEKAKEMLKPKEDIDESKESEEFS